ncbi:hypothetical protein D3C87_1940670 [compost metagenome]
MLVKHPHAIRAAGDKRVQKRPALDLVLAEIDLAEDAGITGKGAVAGNPGQFQIGEFSGRRAQRNTHGGAMPAVSVHGNLLNELNERLGVRSWLS